MWWWVDEDGREGQKRRGGNEQLQWSGHCSHCTKKHTGTHVRSLASLGRSVSQFRLRFCRWLCSVLQTVSSPNCRLRVYMINCLGLCWLELSWTELNRRRRRLTEAEAEVDWGWDWNCVRKTVLSLFLCQCSLLQVSFSLTLPVVLTQQLAGSVCSLKWTAPTPTGVLWSNGTGTTKHTLSDAVCSFCPTDSRLLFCWLYRSPFSSDSLSLSLSLFF